MNIQKRIIKILHYFQRPKKTAKVAKERLQIIIAHERVQRGDKPDYLAALQRDLIDVIVKYVPINKEDVKIELDRQEGCSILELNVTLPNFAERKKRLEQELTASE